MKNYTNINEMNVGDTIKYENPITKIRKEAVFMGKNIEGKYILHFPGESYIYDICIL